MSSKSILVVDDSPTASSLINLHLVKLGYTVTGLAASAEQALQSLDVMPPDLVLMDINLGEGINGIEAADIIMNRYGIPVIYVTSYSDKQTLEAAKQSMPFGFINKPIRDKDLKVNIEIALTRSEAVRRQKTPAAINEPTTHNTEYSVLSEALDHLISGVVMVNEKLQVYYRNKSASKILGSNFPLHIKDKQLVCTSTRTRTDLVDSIRKKTSTMFTINHGTNSLHFLLFPLSTSFAGSLDNKPGSVLFLFDTMHDPQRIEDVVRTLYKLSPTEARIASKLVFNPYLADISVTLGITHHTARTHLKRIYQKTDTKKLSALIQKIVTGPAGLLIHSLD